MKTKKMIWVAAAACVVLQMPLTAAAHGHGHGCGYGHHARVQAPAYAPCNVDGCAVSAVHAHDGVYYCGHYVGDGHVHGVCGVEGCLETAEHEHDGNICMPACGASECNPVCVPEVRCR